MRDTFLEEIFSIFSDALPFWQKYMKFNTEDLALQWNKYKIPFPKPLFLTQLKNLQIAEQKLPDFAKAFCVIPPISIEQATDQVVAFHRASYFSAQSMLDLTAGLGSDFYAHQHFFKEAIAVEQNAYLAKCLEFNLNRLACSRPIHSGDAVELFKDFQNIDFVFIDPARRNDQQSKIIQLSQMEPNILEIMPQLSQIPQVYIKCSPLFQWQEALGLPGLKRIWAISKKGECKEIGIELEKEYQGDLHFRAILAGKQAIDWNIREKSNPITELSNAQFMYEADVSFYVLQASSIAAKLENILGMNHPSAYAFSDLFIENYPGKCFEILENFEYQPKKIKQKLMDLKISKIKISKKNYPDSVETIRKQIGLSDGGHFSLLLSMGINQKRQAWLVKQLY